MQDKGNGEKISLSNNKKLKRSVQTLPNNNPSVCSTATLTFQVKRSPRMRIRGPVMLTTKGLRAAALVRLMTSPSPLAACSFNSGVPLRIPSRNMGRIGAIPYQILIKHDINTMNTTYSQETYRDTPLRELQQSKTPLVCTF